MKKLIKLMFFNKKELPNNITLYYLLIIILFPFYISGLLSLYLLQRINHIVDDSIYELRVLLIISFVGAIFTLPFNELIGITSIMSYFISYILGFIPLLFTGFLAYFLVIITRSRR